MRLGAALLALLGVAPGRQARAEPLRYELRAELGAEYDTNPGRTEEIEGRPATPPIQGSALGRLVLGADAATTMGRHGLALSLGFAGKAFARGTARPEDVLVAQASARWTVLLAARTS